MAQDFFSNLKNELAVQLDKSSENADIFINTETENNIKIKNNTTANKKSENSIKILLETNIDLSLQDSACPAGSSLQESLQEYLLPKRVSIPDMLLPIVLEKCMDLDKLLLTDLNNLPYSTEDEINNGNKKNEKLSSSRK
ncbi:uncharacterized protein CIMG_13154 [Coccidioides immitis RS]|uniref:Uncharacterized protein n=1 Tax=Coccidioides immitis (strain RS) TaxID=246410 RepID=A0A0D8JTP2_COCIM|nr:uncharacterized protein CIMG_13154 [Coccidioides immitis RS]KJF60705.1 hypothetical protein CIMG_13154 [Coccidioides immitis RS]